MNNVSDAPLLVERNGERLTLTLNRPRSANALAPDLVEQLIDRLDRLDGIRLCVIQANGPHFCAGLDLSDIEQLSDGDILWRILRIEHLLQKVQHCPVPVVALAHGQVVGAGADLLAACWYRIASPDTRLMFPGWNFELALGTRRLVQRVGAQQASDMLIDTRKVSVDEAVSCGLLSASLEQDAFASTIDALTQRVTHLSTQAVADMLALTRSDTRDQDLASIIKTAGRPGLKLRILAYRERVQAQRRARKESAGA